MGPIDIKYHVVSLVAVFLALGVGIIVGSNTHLVGTNTLIEKQNQIIERVERDSKMLKQEIRQTQDALKASEDRAAVMEHTTIPALLEGKLSGMVLGTALVGTMPEGMTESAILGPVKKSGAQVGYKLRLSLEDLATAAGEKPDAALKRLAAEILFGTAYGAEQTHRLATDGSLLFGDFMMPVDGVLFIIGDDVSDDLVRNVLVPLEGYIRINRGFVVNALFGENQSLEELFGKPSLPAYMNATGTTVQAGMIAEMSDSFNDQTQRRSGHGGR